MASVTGHCLMMPVSTQHLGGSLLAVRGLWFSDAASRTIFCHKVRFLAREKQKTPAHSSLSEGCAVLAQWMEPSLQTEQEFKAALSISPLRCKMSKDCPRPRGGRVCAVDALTPGPADSPRGISAPGLSLLSVNVPS